MNPCKSGNRILDFYLWLISDNIPLCVFQINNKIKIVKGSNWAQSIYLLSGDIMEQKRVRFDV
jgi:hypothetical protein